MLKSISIGSRVGSLPLGKGWGWDLLKDAKYLGYLNEPN